MKIAMNVLLIILMTCCSLSFVAAQENSNSSGDSPKFEVVKVMPRFPGCEDKELTVEEKQKCSEELLLRYISKKLKYPKEAKRNKIEGTCVIQFTISKEGYLRDFKLLQDIGYGCGEATLAVFESMNEMKELWIPGRGENGPVDVLYTMPIRFKR